MYSSIVGLCMAVVIVAYFLSNPMRHSGKFMFRRFTNWFPLGMTYAFLYMGRYNLSVSKNALGALMTNRDFGVIFGAGTITYAFSFLINGPLVDRIGGRKGILIAALGASGANLALGGLTWLLVRGRLHLSTVAVFSAVYSINMYFQSYGAVSIIKVKAYWFHVRERGVFGAIFGTLISVGVYFAFDWGQAIVDLTRTTWAVFVIPAVILLFWVVADYWLVKDTPEDVGFPPFDTADASSGQMDVEFTAMDLLKKVLTSPLMLMIAVVELTSGVFRNAISTWYFVFAEQVRQPGARFFEDHWGFLLCVFGIVGAFAGGIVSDRMFQSRRAPPTALLCGVVLVLAVGMSVFLLSAPRFVGAASVLIVAASVGITSLMSGTAATDFGGRKATATASGIVDGFAYLGGAIQSFSLAWLTAWDWHWWPAFLVPFALVGLVISLKLWHALPQATRKYIAEVEAKDQVALAA